MQAFMAHKRKREGSYVFLVFLPREALHHADPARRPSLDVVCTCLNFSASRIQVLNPTLIFTNDPFF